MSRGPLITRLGQLAASGEWRMRRGRLLAEDVQRGPHDFVLDLGSGRSPLLENLTPKRYVGLDLHPADLVYARKRFDRPGYEFVETDVLEAPLDRWRGADVVTASALFHHLADEQVRALADRVQEMVQPRRMVFTDSVTRGPLARPLNRLDEGEPSRQPDELYELFQPGFEVTQTWSYVVPFRTYLYFGFELRPAASRGAGRES
jgi:cyclopropane fatty-acyl-phospholipid synthase-like methyltransferase